MNKDIIRIAGAPRYGISPDGRVWSFLSDKWLCNWSASIGVPLTARETTKAERLRFLSAIRQSSASGPWWTLRYCRTMANRLHSIAKGPAPHCAKPAPSNLMLMLDRRNIRQANSNTETCLYNQSSTHQRCGPNNRPKLRACKSKSAHCPDPDNAVGGSLRLSRTCAEWSWLSHPVGGTCARYENNTTGAKQ